MTRFFVTTIDKEWDSLQKATVNIRSYMRRGKMVNAYTQQRLTRGDIGKLMTKLEKKKEGFSWRPWGKHVPRTGFMVGIKGHGEIIQSGSSRSDIYNWFKKQRAFVREKDERFYGGWISAEGKIFLDVSFNDRDQTRA